MAEDEDVRPAEDTDVSRDPGSAGAERGGSGPDVHAYIGRQLRAVYDDVAKQPIPERFIELMKQLESAGGES